MAAHSYHQTSARPADAPPAHVEELTATAETSGVTRARRAAVRLLRLFGARTPTQLCMSCVLCHSRDVSRHALNLSCRARPPDGWQGHPGTEYNRQKNWCSNTTTNIFILALSATVHLTRQQHFARWRRDWDDLRSVHIRLCRDAVHIS